MLHADEYWVIKTEGKPEAYIKDLKKQFPIQLGDFVKPDWKLKSNDPSRISIVCSDGEIGLVGRNQTPGEVCNQPKTINSEDLTRYRNDRDKKFPEILRPRSEKIINLFPIKWRYEHNSEVDVFIKNIDTDEDQIFKYQTGKSINKEKPEQSNNNKHYQIKVCRSGTTKLCSDNNYNITYTVADQQELQRLSLESKTLSSKSNFTYGQAYSVLLYLNQYYDDALDKLDSEFLHGKLWAKYIAGQSHKNNALFEEAEAYFLVLIDSYLIHKLPGSELTAINSCYSLKELYQHFEGSYDQVDILKKKYTSICTKY